MSRLCVLGGLIASLATSLLPAVEPVGGWRGNGTGIWSKGNPPLVWQRLPRGAMEGLRSQTQRPQGDQPGDAPLVEKGQIRSWLVLGPFPVSNSASEFDVDPLGGEAAVQPSEGENLADRAWKLAKVAPDDPMVFGEAGIPWLDLAAHLGFKQNQLGYAHAYLFSPRGGPARIVADHSWGLKAWWNGKPVFRHPERRAVLGAYPGLSRIELEHSTASSSRFDITLRPGWNRLLLKLSTPGPNGHAEMVCSLRIMDPPDVPYDSQNIAWMTQQGEVVRPRDGKVLHRPRGIVSNDTGWTPGVVLGDLLYLPKYGVKNLNVLNYAGQSGDAWQPQHLASLETTNNLNYRPNGQWLDRSTAASPLVVGKYAYMVDMYSELCTFDLEAKKMIHHQTLDLHGFTHYNALAVAASPALINGHLLILDNQGTTLVMTTGPEPKVVHRNVIATQLDRRLPLPAQETLAYAPPIVDGDRIYLRGERYLYCIGRSIPAN